MYRLQNIFFQNSFINFLFTFRSNRIQRLTSAKRYSTVIYRDGIMLPYPLRNQSWRSLREGFSKKESKSRWRFLSNLIRLYWALFLKGFFSSSILGRKLTFSSILISKKLESKAMRRISRKLGNGNIRPFDASVGIRFVLNSLSQLSMILFAFTPTRNNR